MTDSALKRTSKRYVQEHLPGAWCEVMDDGYQVRYLDGAGAEKCLGRVWSRPGKAWAMAEREVMRRLAAGEALRREQV